MKICIRYCGGCNPCYNRKKFVQSLIDALPSHWVWKYTSPEEDTDIILQVAGCSRKCNCIPLSNTNKIIIVDKIDDFARVKSCLLEEGKSGL